jgi:hypothetical protein
MIFESGVYRLDIDADRTQHFYESEDYESCTCAGCRNFAIACHLFPEAVHQFFEQFGIKIGQPAEITAYNSSDGNTTYYDGFYHICGSILAGNDPWLQVGERAYQLDEQYALKVTNDFSVFFTDKCALVEENFPSPVIQMEIQCTIPWVLDEPNPYHYPDL